MKIDTNKKPVPYSWGEVTDNKTYGKVDVSKLTLYQPKGKTLEEVKEEVKDMRVANLAVLDYLKENPETVPIEWKKYWLYFFGTELRVRGGRWYVPYGRWRGGEWHRDAGWLRGDWDSRRRVVLLDDSKTLNNASAEIDALNIAARVANIEAVLKHHNLSLPTPT